MEKDRHAISTFRTFFIRTEIFYWPLRNYIFKCHTSNSFTTRQVLKCENMDIFTYATFPILSLDVRHLKEREHILNTLTFLNKGMRTYLGAMLGTLPSASI